MAHKMSPQKQAMAFLGTRKSIVLSTFDADQVVETSVTPFVLMDGHFYIFVSELAQHTKNILTALQSSKSLVISGLLLADETETEQLFARERLSFQLQVAEVQAQTELYQNVLQTFANEFGEVVGILQGLPDFHLFQLTSMKGGYVRGFGQAFAFESLPTDGLTPVRN